MRLELWYWGKGYKMDIEKEIKIASLQPIRVWGDNELGEILSYFIKTYGRNEVCLIGAVMYGLGVAHGKREERARVHKR